MTMPSELHIPTERLSHDLDHEPPEPCCFCRTFTRHWTKLANRKPKDQVACCQACAVEHAPSDVPTKAQWFKVEMQRMRAKAVGIDDPSRDLTEAEANEACHIHIDRVITSAFPDLAQQLAIYEVRIAELEHERDELQRDQARDTAFTNDRHLRDVAYGDPYIIDTYRRYADDLFGPGQGIRLFPNTAAAKESTP